jgi:hypothetical protein
MNKRINFKDDIFVLSMRIRMIHETIAIKPDLELFLKKNLDDIYFIDQVLRILLDNLEQSNQLNDREEVLEQLLDAENQFSLLLAEMFSYGSGFSLMEIAPSNESSISFKANSLERQRIAEKLLSAAYGETDNISVSYDELTELLKAL